MNEELKEKLKNVDTYIKETEEKLNAAKTYDELDEIWTETMLIDFYQDNYGLTDEQMKKINELHSKALEKQQAMQSKDNKQNTVEDNFINEEYEVGVENETEDLFDWDDEMADETESDKEADENSTEDKQEDLFDWKIEEENRSNRFFDDFFDELFDDVSQNDKEVDEPENLDIDDEEILVFEVDDENVIDEDVENEKSKKDEEKAKIESMNNKIEEFESKIENATTLGQIDSILKEMRSILVKIDGDSRYQEQCEKIENLRVQCEGKVIKNKRNKNKQPKENEETEQNSESKIDEKNDVKDNEEAKVDKKLATLLKEQNVIQAKIIFLTLVKNSREAKKTVDGVTQDFKDYLNNQAEIYGANKEIISDLVEEYRVNLEEEQNQADENIITYTEKIKKDNEKVAKAVKDLRKAKKDKKSSEYKKLKQEYSKLKKEMIKAFELGDDEKYEDLKKIAKHKQEVIKKYDKDIMKEITTIKNCRKDKKQNKANIKEENKKLKERVTRSKVNEIVQEAKKQNKLEKQNGFQKFIGSIANVTKKIGGDGKFNKKVVEPIKKGLNSLGEGIKSAPGKISAKKQKMVNELKANIQKSIEKNTKRLNELQQENEKAKGDKNNEKVMSFDD